MKIACTGLSLLEGKVKYEDPIVAELVEKFAPRKVTPYFVEFVTDGYDNVDAIVIARDSILDLLIPDMERLENRLGRVEDDTEAALVAKSLAFMEEEKPLCDFEVSDEEKALLLELGPASLAPTLILDDAPDDMNALIKAAMYKADVMFFYTAGKPEVHAWFVRKGSDIVTCAGKIHTDLAKGFVKAEIVNIREYAKAHNLNDARAKGLSHVVGREYIIREGDVIDVRFTV